MTHLLRMVALASLLIASAVCVRADVEVAGGKCVLVDGKPFFPVGFYSVSTVDMPLLAKAGFNAVHTYGWEGVRSYDNGLAWLDAAQASGLMGLVGLYRPDVREMNWEASVKRIEQVRDHPALLAWHTMDEPAWDKEGDMGKDYMPAAYEFIRKHDTRHPVTAVVCHFGDGKLFGDSVDVLQADYYPIPPIPANWYSGTGFRGIKQYVDGWRETTGGTKPFWFVAQAFDFSHSKAESNEVPEEWLRMPTEQEMRCMSYTALASGARGIFYWSLSRCLGDAYGRGFLARVEFWKGLERIVGEMNAIMPLLTADTEETILQQDRVVAMLKSDGKSLYVIAANYERVPTKTTIEIPNVGDATAQVMFTDGTLPVREGKLELEFDSIGTGIYRIATD